MLHPYLLAFGNPFPWLYKALLNLVSVSWEKMGNLWLRARALCEPLALEKEWQLHLSHHGQPLSTVWAQAAALPAPLPALWPHHLPSSPAFSILHTAFSILVLGPSVIAATSILPAATISISGATARGNAQALAAWRKRAVALQPC